MTRQEVLDEIRQALGDVPGWLDGLPDPQLEHQWATIAWVLADTQLSARSDGA